MKTEKLPDDLTELVEAWTTCQAYAPLRPIRNADDFARVQEFTDRLADEVGDDENHSLYSLFDLCMMLIEEWERDNVEMPTASGRDVLHYLLEEHGLQANDLKDIAPAELITDILAGRCEISKSLAEALGHRFHIDAGAFA